MKNILITGASRGLGLEITKQELEKNNFVLATYRTLSNDLYNLSKTYTNIKLMKMDVSNNTSVKNAVNKIKKLTKTLDIIYSNAGILNKNHKVNFKNVLFDRSVYKVVNVNTFGFLRVMQKISDLINNKTNCNFIWCW